MRQTCLPRIVCQFAGLILLVAAVISPVRSQSTVVIAGNLGQGGTFQTGTGMSWATGPGTTTCEGSCDPANAVAFTPVTAYTMTQFRFAANWFSGTNSVTVGLYSSPGSNSVSIDSATLIQSFTFSAAAPMTPQLFTAVLTTPLVVSPSNTYFIEMTASGSAYWGWQWNNTENSGYYAEFLPCSGTSPCWFAETSVTPAFEADGVFQGPFTYVGNRTDDTVTVIDSSSGLVVTTITLGCGSDCGDAPAGLAVTPDGKFVYVAIPSHGVVLVIDTSTNTVSTTIPMCAGCASSPTGVAITPDGTRAYVTDTTQFAIEVIDTNPSHATYNMVTTTIISDVGNPNGPIAISPDGTAAYYSFGSGSVGRIDTSTNSHTTTISAPFYPISAPQGLAITPDSSQVYVANSGNGTVTVFTTGINPVTVGSPIPVGSGPFSIAITPNGQFAYVVNQTAGTVSVINTGTKTVAATVSGVGTTPNQIAITPNGREAYVAVGGNNSAAVIYTGPNTVSTSTPIGAGPFGVAVGPAAPCPTEGQTGCETATLNGTAQMITFPFDNNGHSIAFAIPPGWCSHAPCTVTAAYTDTPNVVWQTESANYPGTTIAPIAVLNGDGAVYTVTCTDSTGATCFSPLDYTATLTWQSSQTNFCESGPALGKEETTTWENILGSCSDSDTTISGGSAPKLSRWAAFFGVTGASSATVTITTPANGATYVLGETVFANYSCSGTFFECAGTITNGLPIDTFSLGMKTFTAEAAVVSGPTAKASSSYTITSAYQFIGFFSPVNNPPNLNIATAGRAVPVKFQVLDANGKPVLNLTAPPVSIASVSANCTALGAMTDTTITTSASGSSGFQNLGGGFYQFNWTTLRAWAGTCRQLQVNLGDGVLHVANFQFK